MPLAMFLIFLAKYLSVLALLLQMCITLSSISDNDRTEFVLKKTVFLHCTYVVATLLYFTSSLHSFKCVGQRQGLYAVIGVYNEY